MFENAKWIARQPRPFTYTAPAPYIGKSFTVDSKPQKVMLTYCAVGFGVAYINGKTVTDDVLTTPLSNYDKSVYYNTYDVTELICTGKNTLCFILGNGLYNDDNDHWGMSGATWRDIPRVIASLDITYEGGKKVITTDSSWKCADSPLTYNNIRCGEDYDARLEIDLWPFPDFDAPVWSAVSVKSGPGGKLKPNMIPPIRRIREIVPQSLGRNVYDLGENISGWVEFTVNGNAGDTVRVVYAERLNDDGSIDNTNENELIKELGRIQSDNYILKGGVDETWAPIFTYHGFRYFTLETDATLVSVKGVLAHTDLTAVGEFECSDEMLNKIHLASVKSTLTCYHSIPEDCPQREQNGWTGDAAASAEQAIMNFDMTSAYKQWIDDFADTMRENGQLPCINPNPGKGWYGSWDGGPAWDGALFVIPYALYRYTGDTELIFRHYEKFERYLSYIDTIRDGYTVSSGLGDWNPPSGKRISHKITQTCHYHSTAKIMAEFARITGRSAEPYEVLAANIRADYRKKFIESDIPDMNTQSAIASGIYHGMYEPHEVQAFADKLCELIKANGYHTDCGYLGTKAIFAALSEAGHADVLYRMVTNPTPPSYAYWIFNGMDTLCERWNMTASHNHHYFSEVDHWFYKYLAGIRLSPDGIEVAPIFIDGITWVRARHRDISVYYDEDKLVITVPEPAVLTLGSNKIPLHEGTNEISRK